MIAPQHRVLLIDDDHSLSTLVRMLLEHEGFQVLLAPDGEVGLRLAEQGEPDCILLDITMPYRNGMDVYLDLQHNPRTNDIPIIVFSASISQHDEAMWRGLPHIVNVIHKPFDIQLLAQRLSEVCTQTNCFCADEMRFAYAAPSTPLALVSI